MNHYEYVYNQSHDVQETCGKRVKQQVRAQ